MARYKFDKYAFEDLRTDRKEYDGVNTKAPDDVIPSRTAVEFDSVSKKLKVATTTISDTNKNSTVFILAEDVKPSDTGFVYWVIENIGNLEVLG